MKKGELSPSGIDMVDKTDRQSIFTSGMTNRSLTGSRKDKEHIMQYDQAGIKSPRYPLVIAFGIVGFYG